MGTQLGLVFEWCNDTLTNVAGDLDSQGAWTILYQVRRCACGSNSSSSSPSSASLLLLLHSYHTHTSYPAARRSASERGWARYCLVVFPRASAHCVFA